MEIRWDLLQPVDTGALVAQGFQTGASLVKGIQQNNALRSYMANPDDPQALNALSFLNPQAASALQEQRLRARKMEEIAASEARARAIGGIAAGGDIEGARKAALQSGDFDLAKQFNDLDEASRKRAAEFWQQAGPLAFKLKQITDPQQRQALWAEARPMLEQQGADAKTLDQFDPTNDTSLDAAITLSQKIGDLIDQGKVTWHQQGEQPSFATDFMGRPVGSANPARVSTTAPAAQSAVATTLSSGGLPDHVVAGFLGNFHAEGGYGGAKGDGGTASGIAQWRGERASNFQRIVGKSVSQATPDEQAKFVLWEMQNPEAAGMTVEQRDAIVNAKSPAEAADLIDRFYERSSGEHRARRITAANGFANGAVQVASKAEFDALPSGTEFIAPDGSHRRKP